MRLSGGRYILPKGWIYFVKIRELQSLMDAQILCGEDKLDQDVYSACCSDMMSDVLAFVKDQGVLLTGLVNPQVIRTANMMDMVCIVFVRDKTPNEAMVHMADDTGLVVMKTAMRAYEACGKIYLSGLRGKAEKVEPLNKPGDACCG